MLVDMDILEQPKNFSSLEPVWTFSQEIRSEAVTIFFCFSFLVLFFNCHMCLHGGGGAVGHPFIWPQFMDTQILYKSLRQQGLMPADLFVQTTTGELNFVLMNNS